MGSLMAGWHSHVPDPNLVKYTRNKSLTKEEIESFWKSKKKKEEEHLRDISLLSPRTQTSVFEEDVETRILRANSEPLAALENDIFDMENEAILDKINQNNGWWIRSNSAFLNEPPVIAPDGTGEKYVSQFHITGSTTTHGRTGVSK